MSGFLWFFVVFALLVVATSLYSAHIARKRTELMTGYAAQREWRLTPERAELVDRFRGDPFGKGRERRAYNVIEGEYEGHVFTAFDYSYLTGSGDSRQRHTCSVAAIHLGCSVPMLHVGPTGPFSRLFTGLFGHDVEVGQPDFDEAFTVRCDSVDFAHDVLDADMTAMLMYQSDRAFRLEGDSLLMFRNGEHTPEEVDQVLASMKAIIDQIPSRVWDRLRGDT